MKAASEKMKRSLRVLHLEDNSWDAELIKLELERSAIPCSITQVWTQRDFEAALKKGGIDVILSDSQLPGFDTLKALTHTREACPEVPFVFVSGTSSPAQKANAFFRGATDFVQKDELPKLVSLLDRLFTHKCSSDKVPEVGIPVVVQCAEYSCLAYLGQDGKWRNYARSEELPPVLDWADL
jgi:CheY-like chemotaxis protein